MADTERDREKGGKIWDLPHKLGGIFMVFASRRDPQLLGQVLSKLQDDLDTAGFYHEDRTNGHRETEQVYLRGFDVQLSSGPEGVVLEVTDRSFPTRLLRLHRDHLGEHIEIMRLDRGYFMPGESCDISRQLTPHERIAFLDELYSAKVDESENLNRFLYLRNLPVSFWRETGYVVTDWVRNKPHPHLLAA